jgi:hypothetical protein
MILRPCLSTNVCIPAYNAKGVLRGPRRRQILVPSGSRSNYATQELPATRDSSGVSAVGGISLPPKEYVLEQLKQAKSIEYTSSILVKLMANIMGEIGTLEQKMGWGVRIGCCDSWRIGLGLELRFMAMYYTAKIALFRPIAM